MMMEVLDAKYEENLQPWEKRFLDEVFALREVKADIVALEEKYWEDQYNPDKIPPPPEYIQDKAM